MRVSIICLLLTVLAACTVVLEPENKQTDEMVTPIVAEPQENEMVAVVKVLANSLFDTPDLITADANIAVGTFGKIDTLSLSPNDSSAIKNLSMQIQAGLKAQLARKKIKVIEFRLRNTIALQSGQDVMLSRDLEQIKQRHDIDYFLTGTLTEQPAGVIINAQLVDVETKQIVTAATETISANYWSGSAASTISKQMIYRSEK